MGWDGDGDGQKLRLTRVALVAFHVFLSLLLHT